jgi:hypothetical protein
MMLTALLDFPEKDAAILTEEARGQLERIEISGVKLQTGEFIALEVDFAGSTESRKFLLVADDPAPLEGISAVLPVRASPGVEFSLKVIPGGRMNPGRDANHVMRDETVKIIAVYATNRWAEYLPVIFREDPVQADFLARFLGALFVEGERIEDTLDKFADYVTPMRLPSLAAARFLAGWFDIDLDLAVPKRPGSDQLGRARRFLARVLPKALASGTVPALLTWIDAVAEARGMSEERRRKIAVVEGFKMRRLFTLPADSDPDLPEPTDLRKHWGWLPGSAPLANDPLAYRAFLDDGSRLDHVTLGVSGEDADPTLRARLLGCRLWLFVPERSGEDPHPSEWKRLLAPILPAHLQLEVISGPPAFQLGFSTVLGVTTRLPSFRLGEAQLGRDVRLPM